MSFDVEDFDRQVLQRSREVPVVVDFWAPWCGPCKMLGPALEGLADQAAGQWELVKVNTDEHQALAVAYGISSIPAVKLFKNGAVADEFVGFRSDSEIRDWIARHLPSPIAIELEHAAELIDEGQPAEARVIIERVLAGEAPPAAARLLLAEILLSDEPDRAAAILGGIPPDADEAPHAAALKLLAEAANRPSESLPEDDVKPRLIEGLAAIRRRDWDAALGAFVDVVERRRSYADGLASEAGKAIFRYLGVRHPIADRHYRRFSGAVNA